MNRRPVFATLLVLCVAGSTSVRTGAQTPPTPTIDQILDKYVTASGGRAALEKITSASAKGTIDIPDAGVSGTVELLQKAPAKSLTTVDLGPIGAQREGYDGTIGWSEDPQNGLREKSGGELADAKRSAVFPRELVLKTLYGSMTVKGREQVDGKDAYVVEAVPTEGTPVKMYFGVESGLMVRQLTTRPTPQGPIEVEATFSDFRAVDGVQRPFLIRQATAVFTATIQFTEVKHNVPIDDGVFKMPK